MRSMKRRSDMIGVGSCWFLALLALSGHSDRAWCFIISTPGSLTNKRPARGFVRWFSRSSHNVDDASLVDKEDDDDDDDDEPPSDSSDWVTAEFTLLNLPSTPNPDLDPETVATTCCRSLQWVDYPTSNAGLARCFDFFTWECRKVVTARRGGDMVERFCEHGLLSPALQPFMGAYRVDIGNSTYTPATAVRGAWVSYPIVIQGAPVLAVQYLSGMNRTGVAEPPITHMVMRLEQQRRPPMQGCWLVKEILDVRFAFAGDMGNAHVGG